MPHWDMVLRRIPGRAYRLARRFLPPLGRWRVHRRPFFEILHNLLAQEGVTTFGVLTDRAGEQTYGLVVLLLSLPCLVPGLNVGMAPVGGLGLMAVGAQMSLGRPRPWIPERVRNQALHKGRIQDALRRLEQILLGIRLSRSERQALHPRWTGFAILWSGLLLAIPVPLPFANILPAASLCLLGAALMEERHAWGWLGAAGALATTVYFALSSSLVARALLAGARGLVHHLR